jgi:hypothetical protein
MGLIFGKQLDVMSLVTCNTVIQSLSYSALVKRVTVSRQLLFSSIALQVSPGWALPDPQLY